MINLFCFSGLIPDDTCLFENTFVAEYHRLIMIGLILI
jgi:hypothetical protein